MSPQRIPLKKVRDLPGWPPSNFGSFLGRGHRNPTHAGEVTIKQVLAIMDDHVHFSCDFGGEEWTCDFYVPDRKTAEKVAAILTKHTGESLLSTVEEAIPED